ncbi:MAG: efflux RND transporter periplasmic adaptor subunit [Pirellulaceae bacterium]|nr:efflux RND transporter periplasmic adaptor subunit [Pirellulaceae bacterium]
MCIRGHEDRSAGQRLGLRRSGSTLLLILCALIVVASAGFAAYFYYFRKAGGPSLENVITQTVRRGPFEHVVLEQGLIESSGSVEIRCEVKSATSGGVKVLWVEEEGKHVKKGDKLVQLDSSSFDKELIQQQIVCNTSQAAVILAENTLQAAEIARVEYLEGTFRQEKQLILSEIFVAEENLRRAQLAYQSTERLAAKGIVTSLQLEGDQFAVEKAKNELDSAKTKLEVLDRYTKQKTLKQFDSDITSAKAKWESEQQSYKLEQSKLEDIQEQIAACTIASPEDGQVVYANVYSHRGGSAEFVLEAGATVRENQVLIRLPDPAKMQIKATVNESRISLIRPGMPVEITVDAARDRKLSGSVVKVNQYAEPGSWSSGNIQEYAAYIEIHDPPPQIRTGMNAEVRIFVERLSQARQVPVQALCETKGHYFCLVKKGEDFETREVQVGSSNDTFMTIKSGLEEGEIVVLNPRGFPDKLALPEVLDEKQVTAKIPPKSPPPEGKEKPKVPPPGAPPGPRPAAPGGA